MSEVSRREFMTGMAAMTAAAAAAPAMAAVPVGVELLIRLRSKVNTDPVLDSQCTKRGDVIVAVPLGWRWGSDELRNAQWIIAVVPGMTMDEAHGLLTPEPPDGTRPHRARLRQRRAFHLNLDAIDLPLDRPKERLALDVTTIRAMKRRKAPLPDPLVIGGESGPVVIG